MLAPARCHGNPISYLTMSYLHLYIHRCTSDFDVERFSINYTCIHGDVKCTIQDNNNMTQLLPKHKGTHIHTHTHTNGLVTGALSMVMVSCRTPVLQEFNLPHKCVGFTSYLDLLSTQ